MFRSPGFLILFAFASVAPSAVHAQPSATATPAETSIRESVASALLALDEGDYGAAKLQLSEAADQANRLDLQSIAQRVSAAAQTITPDASTFALAVSSTLNFDNFLKDKEAVEQLLRDPEGNIVRLRVFTGDRDLQAFMAAVKDTEMLRSKGIELAEMRGAPALKSRRADGALSVLMMSDEDHALIELDGDSDAVVMTLIEQLETAGRE